ncbi:MAG: acetoacetate decarboxylase family protein [Deltaproteobacteria bacterium]|nr:MAG: acetoacetate decarboxylase family protein [Deltaproteobacteria bacterium]
MANEDSSIKRLLAARGEGNLWDNARFILADVPLDPRESKRVLPCGLRPSDPPIATLFVSNYPKVSFTVPYREAAVLIHVRTPLGKGLHCCWMLVDDDTALIYGRELLGYPKKMADITFEEKDDHISASVSRRGVKVLTMEGKRGPAQNPPPPVFNHKTFNAGGPGQFFAFNPIWFFRPKEVVRESYSAEVKLTLADSDYDPIARLVSGEPLNGRIAVTDILGSKYNLPVWLTGLIWFANVYNMRFR